MLKRTPRTPLNHHERSTRPLGVVLASAVLALTTLACGATSAFDDDADPRGYEDESISTLEEALSNNESCDTVDENRTTSGWPADYVSSSSYGISGCTKAYRVDANGYFGFDYTTNPREVHWVGYAGPISNNCSRIRFGIYIWKEGTYVGNTWVWGENRGIGGLKDPRRFSRKIRSLGIHAVRRGLSGHGKTSTIGTPNVT